MSAAQKLQPEDMGSVKLFNRTGVAVSPIDSKAQAEASEELMVPPFDPTSAIAQARAEYERDARPVGTMPPPANVAGVAEQVKGMVTGRKPAVLLDKIAERLAFERSGTRLYEALLSKLDVRGTFDGGPSREDLVRFHDGELRHFQLLATALSTLGGDPTAMTPCADVSAVATMGLPQVLADPRTTLGQALQSILIAELADNDGWTLLIQLCREISSDELAERFELAKREEDEHLESVRRWISAYVLAAAHREPTDSRA